MVQALPPFEKLKQNYIANMPVDAVLDLVGGKVSQNKGIFTNTCVLNLFRGREAALAIALALGAATAGLGPWPATAASREAQLAELHASKADAVVVIENRTIQPVAGFETMAANPGPDSKADYVVSGTVRQQFKGGVKPGEAIRYVATLTGRPDEVVAEPHIAFLRKAKSVGQWAAAGQGMPAYPDALQALEKRFGRR